jgi:tetratricopeptide (TPR) repeat protein
MIILLAAAAVLSFPDIAAQADRARESNQNAEAIRLYREALAHKPDWGEGLWYLATLLYEEKQYPAARDALRRFIVQQPDAGPGWALLGMSEVQTREYSRALVHLQRGLSVGLGDRESMAQSVFYYVGALLTRQERFEESMDLLVNAVRAKPSTMYVNVLGLSALRLPYLPEETPADIQPMVRAAGQAVYLLASRRNAEAATAFSELTAQYGDRSGVHFLNGASLVSEYPERGLAEFRREIEITPDHIAARVRLAQEYVKLGEREKALRYAQEAVALDPSDSSAHLAIGEVLLDKGDAGAAIHDLEFARDRAPSASRVRLLLFKAYSAAQRPQDAAREKAALEMLLKERR